MSHADRRAAPGTVLTIVGHEALSAKVNVIMIGAAGIPAAFLVARFLGAALAALCWVAVVALSAGVRYRLRVSADGYVLERFQGWVVRVERRQCLLDWTLEEYVSWDADEPEGLCLSPPSGTGERDTDCFGPSDEAVQARVLSVVHAEVDRLRAQAPPDAAACVPLHAALVDALDPDGQVRHAHSQRLASVRLARAVSLGGVRVPPGSTVHLNTDGWLDPRRPDFVTGVTLAAPVDVAAPRPLRALAGARLSFDAADGRARGCSAAEPFETLGVRVRGPVAWDRARNWMCLELDAAVTLGSFTLDAGTSLVRFLARDAWFAKLPAPEDHAQLGPVRTLQVSADLRSVVGASIDADVVVDGVTLRGRWMPVPLDAAGRVDVAACRKVSLVKPGR